MDTDEHRSGSDANFANWHEFISGNKIAALAVGFIILLFGSSCKTDSPDSFALTSGNGAIPSGADTFTNIDITSNHNYKAFPITDSDRNFFNEIRNAVLSDNIAWMAKHVYYPFTLRFGEKSFKLKGEKDFVTHANLILTPVLKSVVRNQTVAALFKNWQGVMIGNGEIWFSEVGETDNGKLIWTQKILALNLPEDPVGEMGGRK